MFKIPETVIVKEIFISKMLLLILKIVTKIFNKKIMS